MKVSAKRSKSEKIALESVSKWYNTEGFYAKLVVFGYEVIKPYFKGKSLLEIGPADGYMTKLLLPNFHTVTCIEPSTRYSKILKSNFPEISVHTTTIEDFSSPENYDTVISAHVLEHVPNPVKVLSSIKKFMHKNSVLIVVVPNATSLHRRIGQAMGLLQSVYELNELDRKLDHKRVYDMSTLRKDLTSAGLSVQKTGGIFLKPLSNNQLESWDMNTLQGFFTVGEDLPELCAEVYAICTRKKRESNNKSRR